MGSKEDEEDRVAAGNPRSTSDASLKEEEEQGVASSHRFVGTLNNDPLRGAGSREQGGSGRLCSKCDDDDVAAKGSGGEGDINKDETVDDSEEHDRSIKSKSAKAVVEVEENDEFAADSEASRDTVSKGTCGVDDAVENRNTTPESTSSNHVDPGAFRACAIDVPSTDSRLKLSQFGSVVPTCQTEGAATSDPNVSVDAETTLDVNLAAAITYEEEEIQEMERRKFRRYVVLMYSCFALVAIAVVVPVVVLFERNPRHTNVATSSPAPSMMPSTSMMPSSAPTSNRLDTTIVLFAPLSGEEAFKNRTSPQYQAAKWVSDEDPLALPFYDPRFLQRYILATFYFSTNGDKWLQCGRLDPICGGDPNNDSWLVSESHECAWLGIRCRDKVNVDRIFFGT